MRCHWHWVSAAAPPRLLSRTHEPRNEDMRHRKGFTLIELLIVVVIIGILAAIAIPKFANTKEKAVLAGMKSDLRNLVTAQEAFFSDNQTYAPAIGAAQAAGVVAFVPTQNNVIALSTVTAAGWAGEATN